MEYCASITSGGAGMSLVVAMRSLPLIGDIGGGKLVLPAQIENGIDGIVRRDMAGIALEHDVRGEPGLAQSVRQLRHVPIVAEDPKEAVVPLDDACRSGKSVGREARGEHAAFGRPAHV